MLAALLLALAQGPGRVAQNVPSSAVVIVLDDVASADLALYGGPVQTPYLAQLAAQGMVFTNAYAMATCAPTRRVMQTGHWWVTGSGDPCDPPTPTWPSLDEVFIPEALPLHQSAMLGKWHLGGDPYGISTACAPLAHGYDYFLAGMPSNVNECSGQNYLKWMRLDASAAGCSMGLSFLYEPRTVKDSFRSGWLATLGSRFAMVCPNLAHSPFHDPPADLLPPGYTYVHNGRGRFEAMIRAQDTLIGQMLAGMNLEDTLVIVIGDNGTPPPVAPDPDKAKTSIFERGVRVPLIIAGAGTQPGSASAELVHAIDLYATVIDMLGEQVPAMSGPYPVDSVSLRPILAGTPGAVRSFALLATRWGDTEGELGAVSAGGLKYRQEDLDGDKIPETEQLFDLNTDPLETVNRITDPAFAADLAAVRAFVAASVLP